MDEKVIIKSGIYGIRIIDVIMILVWAAFSIFMNRGVGMQGGETLAITIPLVILGVFIHSYLKSVEIIVTNKRVISKSFLGRTDFPVDSVCAVNMSIFDHLKVNTYHGTINHIFVKDSSEIHSILCDILVARQEKLNTEISSIEV